MRSETAEQVWFSVLESMDEPSAFYSYAVRLTLDEDIPFVEKMHRYSICTRIVTPLRVRETLFKMDGPNYGLWYVHIPHAWDGMHYGFRTDGAWDPKHGLRFNPYKFLLDPYAKGVEGRMKLDPAVFAYDCDLQDGRITGSEWGDMNTIDSIGYTPVSIAIDDRDSTKHDADPSHPHVPWSKTVLYELHVKGFTANAPWLPPELRGTYKGLAHPTTLSYLQGLGVTSIELLPIMAKQPEVFLQERDRTNYWGYSTLNFFSPEPSYATVSAQKQGASAVRREVIDMVRALHEAGFEVIMDVVYNHTCEGGNAGPSVCWRGLDNMTFYRQQHTIGQLEDTTGCGNTIDFTNTHNITFAVDSLRYWAKRIGIDGFRFDLAVSLARLNGVFTPFHPFLYALRADQLLGNLKMIMEPWDLGNQGWRTGQFLSPFAEWNDRFRDTSRTFWISDVAHGQSRGSVGMQEMATRLCGSADLFATDPGRGATSSVNYITAHDGFTLSDLTQYSHKHNEANGENNNDGANVNHSANFGVEGPSEDRDIIAQRQRADMNMLGTLLLSLGTPMMLAGDEFGNTQFGNNNAYCQDNDITWLDWQWLTEKNITPQYERMESVSKLIAVRKSLDIYNHEDFFTRLSQLGLLKPSSRVQWLLPDGTTPMERNWFDTSIRAFTMRLLSPEELGACIVINGGTQDQQFHLPAECGWHLLWSSTEILGEQPKQGASIEHTVLEDTRPIWGQTIPSEQHHMHGPLAMSSDQIVRTSRQKSTATASTEKNIDKATQLANTNQALLEAMFDDPLIGLIKKNVADSATPSSPVVQAPTAGNKQNIVADDTLSPNVWTFPAQSISILLQKSIEV